MSTQSSGDSAESPGAVDLDRYRSLRRRGLTIARSYRLAAADTEDVVQEALVRMMRVPTEGDGAPRRYEAYFDSTVRHLCIDVIRQHGRERELPDPEALPEQTRSERNEQRMLVREVLAGMSPSARSILVKNHIEGRSVTEIASALGVTANACSAMLYRARRNFRERFLRAHLLPTANERCAAMRALMVDAALGTDADYAAAVDEHRRTCEDCDSQYAFLLAARSAAAAALLPGALAAATASGGILAFLHPRAAGRGQGRNLAVAAAATVAVGLVVVGGWALVTALQDDGATSAGGTSTSDSGSGSGSGSDSGQGSDADQGSDVDQGSDADPDADATGDGTEADESRSDTGSDGGATAGRPGSGSGGAPGTSPTTGPGTAPTTGPTTAPTTAPTTGPTTPGPQPTSQPTAAPTSQPTTEPTPEPTTEPTPEPQPPLDAESLQLPQLDVVAGESVAVTVSGGEQGIQGAVLDLALTPGATPDVGGLAVRRALTDTMLGTALLADPLATDPPLVGAIADPRCSAVGATQVRCELGDVPAGGSTAVEILTAGWMAHRSLGATLSAQDRGQVSASVAIAAARLPVEIGLPSEATPSGEPLTVTIVGPADGPELVDVVVTFAPPDSGSFDVEALDPSCVLRPDGSVACTVPSIAPGQAVTVVGPRVVENPDDVEVAVTVTGGGFAPVTVTAQVAAVRVAIAASFDSQSVPAGRSALLTVRHGGATAVPLREVSVWIRTWGAGQPSVDSDACVPALLGGLICSLGTIEPGASSTIEVSVPEDWIANLVTATVTASNAVGPVTASTIIEGRVPDPVPVEIRLPEGATPAGTPIEVTIAGPEGAPELRDVVVAFAPPTSGRYDPDSLDPACTLLDDGSVTCTIASIPAGESVTVAGPRVIDNAEDAEVLVTVSGAGITTVTTTAVVAATPALVPVLAAFTADSVPSGAPLTLEIGPSAEADTALLDVVVTVTSEGELLAGTEACSATEGGLTCTIERIDPGGRASLELFVAESWDPVQVTATVSASNAVEPVSASAKVEGRLPAAVVHELENGVLPIYAGWTIITGRVEARPGATVTFGLYHAGTTEPCGYVTLGRATVAPDGTFSVATVARNDQSVGVPEALDFVVFVDRERVLTQQAERRYAGIAVA